MLTSKNRRDTPHAVAAKRVSRTSIHLARYAWIVLRPQVVIDILWIAHCVRSPLLHWEGTNIRYNDTRIFSESITHSISARYASGTWKLDHDILDCCVE